MRMPRRFTRRPRPAAILAAALATAFLGAAAAFGPTADADARDSAPSPSPRPAASSTAPAAEDPMVTAYNAGWRAGVADLGDGTAPTHPNVTGDGSNPGTVAWVDGWIDGQADALGDDNRDGIVDEDESGWDCATMGNRQCGPTEPAECRGEIEFADLCATVAAREAYAYTDADGTTHAVPSGREQIARLNVAPGTDAFAAALFELDTRWVQHNEN